MRVFPRLIMHICVIKMPLSVHVDPCVHRMLQRNDGFCFKLLRMKLQCQCIQPCTNAWYTVGRYECAPCACKKMPECWKCIHMLRLFLLCCIFKMANVTTSSGATQKLHLVRFFLLGHGTTQVISLGQCGASITVSWTRCQSLRRHFECTAVSVLAFLRYSL